MGLKDLALSLRLLQAKASGKKAVALKGSRFSRVSAPGDKEIWEMPQVPVPLRQSSQATMQAREKNMITKTREEKKKKLREELQIFCIMLI